MVEDAITLPEKMLELCKHHDKKDSVLLPGDSSTPCHALHGLLSRLSTLPPDFSPLHLQADATIFSQTSSKLGKMVRQDMEELAGDVMGRMLSFPPPEHHPPDVGGSKIIFSTQNPGNTKK